MAARREKSPTSHLRDLDRSLPMQLLHAREAAMARFRPMLRQHGLTEQQWRVVRVLNECPGIDAGELARKTMLLAPSLTRILQNMESTKLVVRHTAANDQRRAAFMLTAAGRARFDAVAPDSEALYIDIEAQFGRKKLATLYTLLKEFSVAVAP